MPNGCCLDFGTEVCALFHGAQPQKRVSGTVGSHFVTMRDVSA